MDPDILKRLRTLVDDVCGQPTPFSAPRLILDVIDERFVDEFVEAVCDEYDIVLPENFVDEDTTFRELLEFLTEP